MLRTFVDGHKVVNCSVQVRSLHVLSAGFHSALTAACIAQPTERFMLSLQPQVCTLHVLQIPYSFPKVCVDN